MALLTNMVVIVLEEPTSLWVKILKASTSRWVNSFRQPKGVVCHGDGQAYLQAETSSGGKGCGE